MRRTCYYTAFEKVWLRAMHWLISDLLLSLPLDNLVTSGWHILTSFSKPRQPQSCLGTSWKETATPAAHCCAISETNEADFSCWLPRAPKGAQRASRFCNAAAESSLTRRKRQTITSQGSRSQRTAWSKKEILKEEWISKTLQQLPRECALLEKQWMQFYNPVEIIIALHMLAVQIPALRNGNTFSFLFLCNF